MPSCGWVSSMQIATLRETLQAAFFQWGWLLVAVLPLAQLGGRTLYTVLVSLYALAAIVYQLGLFDTRWARKEAR